MKNVTLPIRYGLLTSAGLIIYFITLSSVGLHTNPIMSLFNAVITGLGIYAAIKTYKIEQGTDFEYGAGFKVGIITGFVATIFFTAFFLLYATEFSPLFLSELLTVFKGDYNVHIGLVSFVVAIMGFGTSVVLTLTCMQLFKPSWNIPEKA